MKLPTRLELALGTLTTGLIALSLETKMSHPLHVVCGLVGSFVLFLIPAGQSATPAPPQSSRTPDGAAPQAPPETI